MVLPALPQGYLLRPATAADRGQIHRLLKNFERETQNSLSHWQTLIGMIAAVLLATLISWEMVVLTIVAFGSSFLWMQVSPWFSSDWKQYWVIVDRHQGRLIACAKLCRYRHYSLLFNLLVAPAYRCRGFGSVLVRGLSQKAAKPLYLACYADRVSFYTRLGFEPVAPRKLSAIVRHDLGLTPHSKLLALKLGPSNGK